MDQSILWPRLDRPGHEFSRLFLRDSFWHLAGTAVFAHDQRPCRLDYLIVCDSEWRTLKSSVVGWVESKEIELQISVDGSGRWQLNGMERPEVEACVDIDLNFSPSSFTAELEVNGAGVVTLYPNFCVVEDSSTARTLKRLACN